MSNISTWSTSAGDNNATPPDGFPEGMLPSGVNDAAREVMAAVRRWYEAPFWTDLGYTHTFATATSFTVAADVTAFYTVGRRIRIVGSGTGTRYGWITSSSYSAPNTTVGYVVAGTVQNEALTISISSYAAADMPLFVADYALAPDASDDTEAIQAAIDACEATRGAFVGGAAALLSRVYTVSDTITIDGEGVSLIGLGSPVVEQQFTTDVNPVGPTIKLADSAFTSASKPIVRFIYQGTGSEARLGALMRDIVVFGNRSKDTAAPTAGGANNNNTYGIGVQIVGARYVTLENVHCAWCAEDGFQAISGGSQSSVSNNLDLRRCVAISNVDDGFDIAAGDSRASDCQAGFNGGDGLALSGGIQTSGCLSWNNFQNGYRISGSENTLVGGYAQDNKAAGILVSGAIHSWLISGIRCVGNGQDSTLTDQERSGIYVSGAGVGVIDGVSTGNNTGETTQKYGLRIAATGNVRWDNVAESGEDDNAIATVSDLSERRGVTETATGTFTLSPEGVTLIDSSGGTVTGTLGSGRYYGEMKLIVMTDATASSTVSVTNHATSDPEVFTFDAVDEALVLMWTGTEWVTIHNQDVTT